MQLFFLYLLSQISAQEFFSSHEALKRLEIKESFMLKEFQASLEKKLEEVSSLLSDLSEIKDDRGENIDHPLDQFKVRFYHKLFSFNGVIFSFFLSVGYIFLKIW